MISEKPHKKEALILALALLVCALAIAVFRLAGSTGTQVLVVNDGVVLATLDLRDYPDGTIIPLSSLGVEKPVSFEVSGGRIRFVNVTCPDHLCEGFGYINLSTQTAVCMPNKISLSISLD